MRASEQIADSPELGSFPPEPGSAARWAGAFLLLTGVATAVSVMARVSAGADQPTLAESLAAISQSQAAYGLSGGARLVSGIALAVAGLFLYRLLSGGTSPSLRAVAVLLVLSGVVTAASGVASLALAQAASGAREPISDGIRVLDEFRWIAGKLGFTLAGLGLLASAWPQLGRGGPGRVLSIVSAVIGAAMLFIWVDAATVMHRISGTAFLVWALAAGGMLLIGRWGVIPRPER